MSTQAIDARLGEPTLASTWRAVAGSPIRDELLEWPPDVFALTDVILDRAEAYRFVLSRRTECCGLRVAMQAGATRSGRQRDGGVRGLRTGMVSFLSWWRRSGRPSGASRDPLEELAAGRNWPICEALLTLHAIADEACAGLFVALDRSDGEGCCYRA